MAIDSHLERLETLQCDSPPSLTSSPYESDGSSTPSPVSWSSQPSDDDESSLIEEKMGAQFIFQRPTYNKAYHHTHFHHPSHKKLPLLQRFFRSEKRQKRPSFANEFNQDLEGKYGQWGRFVGKGAGGSVRLIQSVNGKTLAVKEFRKRGEREAYKDYVKKVTAEFCIGSTLHHPNIIETLDMIQEGGRFFEIMAFAPNDLFNIVMSGRMTADEMACCWRQLLNGVAYMHSMGLAHRDLKLDNMVLDERGVVKIIDFGCAVVQKYPLDDQVRWSSGVCGSDPYIAPEQFSLTEAPYDAAAADLWSCAIIFLCMHLRRFPWRLARSSDPSFQQLVLHGPQKILALLPPAAHPALAQLLVIDPHHRISLQALLDDPWVHAIPHCSHPHSTPSHHLHHLYRALPSFPYIALPHLIEPSKEKKKKHRLFNVTSPLL
ncbi:kinase-like domain-containing protein [Sporodiniella umbellata]|nr:kinase-like domain-containing protein [Sporodiniella umbellata]